MTTVCSSSQWIFALRRIFTDRQVELLLPTAPPEPTCVVEDGGADGAVLKHCVCGPDVFKATVFKERVLKLH